LSPQEQIVELREEFEKIDSGDGEITLAAMKQVLVNPAGAGALGDLTDDEVEDIFDALRVNKNDSTIRWHEFIAAGLSQCQYDDRNLRLAFDRFDTDRKG
jgi:calcium-dependent protein kinase